MFRRTLTVAVAVTVALAGQVVAASSSYAASSSAGIYSGIDGYPIRKLPESCITTPQPGAVFLHDLLLGNVGGRHLGYTNCSDSTSYHRESRAFDWGMNASNAFEAARVNEVLHWLLSPDERGNLHANARRLGIGEIIWNRQMITLWDGTTTGRIWRPYGGASAHTDHVHFSLSWAGARKETSFYRSRNSTPLFALSDSLSSSSHTIAAFYYGFGASEVFAGDWDESGGDGVGIYDPTSATFFLRNCTCSGTANHTIRFGNFGDKPIAGDWDGDGQDDIGVYRPTNQTFYFHMLNGAPAPGPVRLGNLDDLPIIADWNGDGRDEIGVYRPGNQTFYLPTGAIYFGSAKDVPIAGDWNGDRIGEIGVYRPSNSTFYFLTVNGNGQSVVRSVGYGNAGSSVPVIGDWNGNGQDTQGVIFL